MRTLNVVPESIEEKFGKFSHPNLLAVPIFFHFLNGHKFLGKNLI